MDRAGSFRGLLAPRRLVLLLMAGLALTALMAAAIATTRVPPRPPGRVLVVAPVSAQTLTEAEQQAAQARIAEALGVMRAHAIARRLAEADAVLAAVRAGADPAAIARWEAQEAAARAPLPRVDEPPAPLPLPGAILAVEEPPAPLPLIEPPVSPLAAIEEPPLPAALAEPAPPLAVPQETDLPEAVLAAMVLPPAVAPLPPADAKAPAPAAAGSRVFIHHVSRAAEADRVAGLLPEGVELAAIRAVRATPAAPDIRYFFAEDRPAAERLAQALSRAIGGRVPARNFSHVRPLPRPGTLEIWLPQP